MLAEELAGEDRVHEQQFVVANNAFCCYSLTHHYVFDCTENHEVDC
jgi:hypothetical protein